MFSVSSVGGLCRLAARSGRRPSFLMSLFAVGVLAGGVLPAQATEYFVATNGNGTAGTSWATAFTNLQTALNAAASNDTIYVAGHTFGLSTQLVWTTSYVTVRGGVAAAPEEARSTGAGPTSGRGAADDGLEENDES